MKIIFLNAWHGRQAEDLASFLKQQAPTTDIFCFQEVSGEMHELCWNNLKGYKFAFTNKHVNENDGFTQGIYIKNSVPILDSGTVGEQEPMIGLGQYVQVMSGHRRFNICNFHGMSRPVDKLDHPDRLRQSEYLLTIFDNLNDLTIIGGDFNMFPQTKSIHMFEQNGYVDLIKKFGVTNTRNHLAWDRFPDNPKQYFSDYVFVTPGVKVKSFEVPDNEVSDHLPLILQFE